MRQLALIIQRRRQIYVCTANAKQKRNLFLTVSPSTFNLFRVHTKQCSRETPVVRLKSLLLCVSGELSVCSESRQGIRFLLQFLVPLAYLRDFISSSQRRVSSERHYVWLSEHEPEICKHFTQSFAFKSNLRDAELR